jgi:hypothetical protein
MKSQRTSSAAYAAILEARKRVTIERTPLLNEVERWSTRMDEHSVAAEAQPVMVGVRLKRDGIALNLFATITTLEAPQDVTLQEVRIETLFPADASTKKLLAARASSD